MFCQTSLPTNPSPPPGLVFLRIKKWPLIFFSWEWTIDARNKFYTWSHLKIFIFDSVIFVHFCPKSDISGALGPLHYITLKSFTMNLMDGTNCKTCFGCPRMVICGPWKTVFFFSKIEFGESPDFSAFFFVKPSLIDLGLVAIVASLKVDKSFPTFKESITLSWPALALPPCFA